MFKMHLGHKRGKLVAVADVGTGSAAIALMTIEPGAPARVIAAERAILPIETRSQDATITGVATQLTVAGEKIQKTHSALMQKGAGPVKELFVILRAPWVRSRVARALATFKGDSLITSRMITDMAEKMLAEDPALDKNNLLEATIVRTELNGYPCAKPAGKHARSLSVFALLSEAAAGVRPEVESSLQKIFPHLTPVFRSATRASIGVLKVLPGIGSDYVVVDIASEGTILTSVRDGIAAEHEQVPEGMRGIVQRITVSGLPEETLSMMRMVARDECSDPACEAIRTAITRVEPELVRIFGEVMAKCIVDRRLPNTLVLLVHPDLSNWLSKFFSRIDFAQFTQTTQPFTVRSIETGELSALVRPEDGVSLDSGLALSCGLVNIGNSRV